MDFKDKAKYLKWLEYIKANKLSSGKPQPVKIKGETHKVDHSKG
jgi:hypothetical protein